jgi:hypothetical protein
MPMTRAERWARNRVAGYEREETDLLTQEFRSKILGAMSVKNVRRLYPLDEQAAPARLPAGRPCPPAAACDRCRAEGGPHWPGGEQFV